MIAPGLAAVLLVARVAVLWARPVEWTPLLFLACVGQDALVAAVFLLLEASVRRRRWGRRAMVVAFWAITPYVAVNAVVARVLPTPLTWPMIRAAGGPMADSIQRYVTPSSVVVICLIIGSGVAARTTFRRVSIRPIRMLGLALVLAGLGGTVAATRVETWGLHRNALVALATSTFPAVDAHETKAAAGDAWRRPPFETPPAAALSFLRGAADGRSVVIIGLESTAAQYLQSYGARENVMPRLEELTRSAVVFDWAYAVSPDSIRSLFSVLCSRYPAFDTPVEAYGRAPCGALSGALQARGYRTALFHSGRFGYLGMNEVIRDRGFDTLEDAGHIGGNHESSFGVDEPATVARILSWIDAVAADGRFVAHYMPIAGHHPYAINGPGAFGSKTDLDRYRSALQDGDVSIGVLIDGLKSRGLFEKTMFVVYGDHGQAFNQHPGNVGHTFYLYEENVRIPFFVALPGLIAETVRSNLTTSLVDVAPTVFDLLGLPADSRHQGITALNGQARTSPFFTDYGARLVGLRDGPWKFIHDLDAGRSQLFRLDLDPAERQNQEHLEPERVAAYRQTLTDWSSAQKALMGSRARQR